MKKKKRYIREFKCPICGSSMFASKRKGSPTPPNHIKTMYCYNCKRTRPFIQLNKYGDKEDTLNLKHVKVGIRFNIPTFNNMLDFGYEVGDIILRYGDKNLTIGFDSWTCKDIKIKKKTTLIIESGHGEYDSYSTISKDYLSKIKKQGFNPETLNATFLYNMDEIININLHAYVGDKEIIPSIEKIYFVNYSKRAFYVDNAIIEKYNSIL